MFFVNWDIDYASMREALEYVIRVTLIENDETPEDVVVEFRGGHIVKLETAT